MLVKFKCEKDKISAVKASEENIDKIKELLQDDDAVVSYVASIDDVILITRENDDAIIPCGDYIVFVSDGNFCYAYWGMPEDMFNTFFKEVQDESKYS